MVSKIEFLKAHWDISARFKRERMFLGSCYGGAWIVGFLSS